jgi:mycothiol synthase
MNVLLVDMAPVDFTERRAQLVRDTADALMASRGMTPPEAEARASETVAASLPAGPRTPGHLVRTALGADGRPIGWIWVAMPGHAMPSMAWICDVVVDEPYRRHGYGAAVLAAAELELAELGVGQVGLNVYGSNETARRLYERQGYQVIRQVRARHLSDVSGQPPAGVTLTPIKPGSYERRMDVTEATYPPEREVRRAMPQGLRTPGMFVFDVVADGAVVGWIWYGLHGPERPGMAWIHQLDIDEPYRGRGYGTAALAAAEADLARHGARSAGLFVRGSNTGAQRLYERLGFELISQEMVKHLPAL